MSTSYTSHEDQSTTIVETRTGEAAPSIASGTLDEDQSNVCANVLECFICMEPPTDPVSTSCGHVFCWPCIYRWLDNQPKPCPTCRYVVRRDMDIIPLYGASSELGATSDGVIPPRPRNPLMVMATARTDGSGYENLTSLQCVLTPRSVFASYERSITGLSHELSAERDRVLSMGMERINLELQVSSLERRAADYIRQVQDRDWQLFVERNQSLQTIGRVNDLEQNNLMLTREALDSRERELRQIERGNQLSEHNARLQQQLDQANDLLARRSSNGE